MDFEVKCINLLNELGIDYFKHSEKKLEEVIGEKIDYKVLNRVIEQEKLALFKLKAKNMPQSYRFCALRNIVSSNYFKVKEEVCDKDSECFDINSIVYRVVVNIQNNLEEAITHEVRNILGDKWDVYTLDRDFVIEALNREAARRNAENTYN